MGASILIVPSTGNAITTTGLVSWWSCDESSGIRYDEHGSNDLTDNNTVTSVTGIIGNACEFTASQSEYLSITDAAQTGLDFSTAFTFATWVNFDNNANTDYALVSKRAETAGTNSYLLYLNGASNYWYTYLSGDGTAETAKSYTWNPSQSVWYHVVTTYDAGTTKFYVDGTLITTQTGSPASLYNNSQPFRIGVTNVSDGDLDGHLDEISAWNIALTASSVEELYNGGDGLSYSDINVSTTTATTTATTTTTSIDVEELKWVLELYLAIFSFLIFTYVGYRFTKFFL